MNDFFDKLADLLGAKAGDVKADSELDNFDEWDSLGALTVVSMIDSDYHVTILSEEIASVENAGQLWAIVQSKRT